MTKLLIVESPSKAKTIEKYLGKDYHVVSSKGHVRDLSLSGPGRLGIDIENDFAPKYTISKDKKAIVKDLKALAKKSDEVFLASDPDREGEAIAWHLAQVLDLDENENNRVVFNEITKPAILEAVEHPRKIDEDMFESQETRRMLDRIIGFKLSSLLNKKIKSKSAGRVQSVALKLIVDREREIEAFKPEEYWSVDAKFLYDKQSFEAQLKKVDGKKPKLNNKENTDEILARLGDEYQVVDIDNKIKKKQPKMPFITSTLQQEASTKLNFSAKKTMSVAQKLYEGIQIGNEHVGLISYMRTDSYRLSPQFTGAALDYIEKTYGKKYCGRIRQKKDEHAQDAHEAIRPTDVLKTPDSIKSYLTNDQYKLYKLIYARTLASLMAPSDVATQNVKIMNNGVEFNASGAQMVFDGYLKVYQDYETISNNMLPELKVNDLVTLEKLDPKQHFTEPPKRYSEARLIKEMEENGIGRPSTYAMILDTLQARDYVELKKQSEQGKVKVFYPTEQGILTNDQLQKYFDSIINVKYTADMENDLDKIAEGELSRVSELRKFYDEFMPLLEKADQNMEKIQPVKTGEKCPECGDDLVIRKGRYGEFVACNNYPKCKYVKLDEDSISDEKCPECGSNLIKKRGRYGEFWACSNYPECKYVKSNKKKAEKTGEKCPECGKDLVKRTSRYGKEFIACSGFPKCRYIKKEEKEDKK